MTIIALTGVAGSGKSTVAKFLVEDHGYTEVSLAAPLKEVLYKVNPDLDDGYGCVNLAGQVDKHGWDVVKRKYPVVREMLQDLGQAIRAYQPDFFIRVAEAEIERMGSEVGYHHLKVVIPDCRFPNEAMWVRLYTAAYVVRVAGRAEKGVRADASEAGLPDDLVDFDLRNVVGMEALRRQVGWYASSLDS